MHIKSLFLVQQTVSKCIDLCELGLSKRRKEERKERREIKACLETKARCYIVPAYELDRLFSNSYDRNPVHPT